MLRFSSYMHQFHLRDLGDFTLVRMGPKSLLKPSSFSSPFSPFSSIRRPYKPCKCLIPVVCSQPVSKTRPYFHKTNGFNSISTVPAPVYNKDSPAINLNLRSLRRKLEELGIELDEFYPGQHNHLVCPMCNGGDSAEKTFSLVIEPEGNSAAWTCFRAKCGWNGGTKLLAGRNSTYESSIKTKNMKPRNRKITVESLELEPLCNELGCYFAERLITEETLQRNRVMQRSYGDQIVIAFTYWREGVLTSCKYRDSTKKFWQESDTEKIFYGLDDIKDADDIIIVEGEMDKLSMEEAGFRNCVSVPDGAPPQVSQKDLPSEEQDTKYRYLWNCKEYLKKASRIILATDGDSAGQALAEELARRIGRERCWRVRWPKKNKDEHFKDANEVRFEWF